MIVRYVFDNDDKYWDLGRTRLNRVVELRRRSCDNAAALVTRSALCVVDWKICTRARTISGVANHSIADLRIDQIARVMLPIMTIVTLDFGRRRSRLSWQRSAEQRYLHRRVGRG